MEEMIIVLIFGMISPLLMAGFYLIISKLIELIMVKRGAVKLYFVTRNHGLKRLYRKPEGSQIKIGNKSYDYDDSTGKVIRDGLSPAVFYNEKTAEQMDMTNQQKVSPIDPNHFSDMLIRAFNLGVISSQREDKNLKLFLLITMFASIGACIGGLLAFNQVAGMSDQIMPVLNEIRTAIAVSTV